MAIDLKAVVYIMGCPQEGWIKTEKDKKEGYKPWQIMF
jgi:hypothetical protein